jgi:P4 family phage/plasmid primase-like protien
MTCTLWEPHVLAVKLDVTVPDLIGTTTTATVSSPSTPAEPVNLATYPRLQAELDNNTGDRSKDTMRIMGACFDAGLTYVRACWVVHQRSDLADRLADRKDDDLQRCWNRVVDSRQTTKFAIDLGAPTGSQDSDDTSDGELLDQKNTNRAIALTDKGNALALVAAHANHLRYIPEMGKWMHWTHIQWRIDADTAAIDTAAGQIAMNLPAATKAAFAHKKRSLSRSGITGMVRLAQSDPDIRVNRGMLDANSYELNTPTGIVDLRTGTLGEHRPDALHTKVTGVAYDPNADCPLWKAFLVTTFGNNIELINYIQKLTGYAAIGEVFHHILPFLFGAGHNGKTVLLEVVARALGDYAITAPANFLLAGQTKHETEIARLAGARLVVCSEINQGTKFDEAKVKLLTGGDTLTGRFMYRDFFNFRPSHTLFLIGNHQPAVGAGGDSFWRRVRLIPFEHRVPDDQRIEHLDAKLIEREGPAILAWIVRGAVAVATQQLKEPEAVMSATEDYAESEDHVQQFVDECITKVTRDFRVPSGEVYQRYMWWCKENGIPAKASGVFGRDLSSHGHKPVKLNGKRYVLGIMLDTPTTHDPRNPE